MANIDTLQGSGRDVVGKIKETAGDATGNRSLQGDGLIDQLGGKAQKVVGQARDAFDGRGDLVEGLRDFARRRPVLATTLAGILGVALLNTLRGK